VVKTPKTVIEAMSHVCATVDDTLDVQRAFLAGVSFAVHHCAEAAEAERLTCELGDILRAMTETVGPPQ
jgi:hypothetical protein